MKTLTLLWLTLAFTSALAENATSSFNGVWQLEGNAITQLRTTEGKQPPLRDAARKVYQQRTDQLAKGDHAYDPGMQCKPLGNPRLLWEERMPFDLQVTAKRIMFGYTWNRLHRLVDVQPGDPMPAGPSYMGTSNAQIEGDTMVVRSAGYHESTLLDTAGLPHSYDLTMVERYQLKNKGQALELRIRFTDEQTFTQPWETVIKFKRVPNGRIREDVCQLRKGLYKEETVDSPMNPAR